MQSHYIYCYTNKINGHKYVGQTSNIKRRQAEHLSHAMSETHKDNQLLFHKKIKQYGINNFHFEILEEIPGDNLELVDEREKFWIKEKNSYVKNGEGYNITQGGQNQNKGTRWELSKIDQTTLKNIIFDIKNSNLTLKAIADKYNVKDCYISSINIGKKFKQSDENYPLRPKKVIDKKEIENFMLINKNYTQTELANYFNISVSTIKRIKSQMKKPVSTMAD